MGLLSILLQCAVRTKELEHLLHMGAAPLHQYQNKFNERFHQSKLHKLSTLGFLRDEDTSRAGKRRYYTIVDPEKIGSLLRKWNLE